MFVNNEQWLALSSKDIKALFAVIRKDIPAKEKVAAIKVLFAQMSNGISEQKNVAVIKKVYQLSAAIILNESSRNNSYYKFNRLLPATNDLWFHVLETMPMAVKEKPFVMILMLRKWLLISFVF